MKGKKGKKTKKNKEKKKTKSSKSDKELVKEMDKWYNKLKVFLSFPPKYAGFNLCWLEAKAAGVPRIFGNENGVGLSNIGKHWKEMSIENHAKKLLEIFKNEKDGIITNI